MMVSAAQSYAARNNISENQAFNELMDKSSRGEAHVGAKAYGRIDSDKAVLGKLASLTFGGSVGGEIHGGGSQTWAKGSTDSTTQGGQQTRDHSADQSSQELKDFRQGKDMVQSYRVSHSGSHTDNTANTQLDQLGATLSVADSQYSQYTSSLNRSHEYSQMASSSDTTSANMQSNYAQEFVGYVQQHAPAKADELLTNTASSEVRAEREQLAGQFMEDTLRSRVEGDYQQHRSSLTDGMETVQPQGPSGNNTMASHTDKFNNLANMAGIADDTQQRVDSQIGDNGQVIARNNDSISHAQDDILRDRQHIQTEQQQATDNFESKHAAAVVNQDKEDPRAAEAVKQANELFDKEKDK